jgi:molecular chaperone DnaK
MSRTKIDYGIDLGTTNSSIARIDYGESRILKSDDFQTDTTSSCVHYNKKKVCFVGQKALNQYSSETLKLFKDFTINGEYKKLKNTFIEFKRTMGTDEKYESSNMVRSFTSEELSSEVLKKLKSYVRDDVDFHAVVITVPAKFQQHQVAATNRAAALAGFQHCELLQEPIAASMAYGVTERKTDGFWLVFDFGGGTFDAALMRVEEGIIKVHDTSGDNHLGGKNIDLAIVDEILIPHLAQEFSLESILNDNLGRKLLREALKSAAEEIKIAFAGRKAEVAYYKDDLGEDDEGEELTIDITIPLEQFEEVVSPILQRAIDITRKLLHSNNLTGEDLATVILVGGPTYLETLRNMLRSQVTEKIDYSIDPMTAVTRGAALYASTRDIPADLQVRDRTKIQLKLKYQETTVEITENLGIKVERAQTEGVVPDRLFADVARSDGRWSTGKFEIAGDAEIVGLDLMSNKSNGFTVTLYDEQGTIFPCEPSTLTIIQGMVAPKATLPMTICVETLSTEHGKQLILPVSGLEKNKSLPTKGKLTGRTQMDLRPGNKNDLFEVRIFEAEEPYTRPFPHEWIATIPFTGEDMPQFLPKESEVEITLHMDESRRITCECYFPAFDDTTIKGSPSRIQLQGDFPAEKLEQDIKRSRHALDLLINETDAADMNAVNDLKDQLDEIDDLLEQGREDSDRKNEVARRIGEVIKETDKLSDQVQWPKAEQELNDALAQVARSQQLCGDDQTAQAFAQMQEQAAEIKRKSDVNGARLLTSELWSLDYHMVKEQIGYWAGFIMYYDKNIDVCEWKAPASRSKQEARALINEGKEILATKPSRQRVEEIVRALFDLLARKDDPISGVDNRVLKH